MTLRRRLALGGAAAVLVATTVAIIGIRAGWFQARVQHVPTCAQIFAWPAVEPAVQEAFPMMWGQREERYSDLTYLSLCHIDASLRFFGDERPEPGTPRDRSFSVHPFAEDLQQFRGHRSECQKSSNATGLADEAGLGGEAFSCWTTHKIDIYRYLYRHLRFRGGEISFSIELGGANYGPQTDLGDRGALRTDLERHTRCIAEALASHLDPRVSQSEVCRGAAQVM